MWWLLLQHEAAAFLAGGLMLALIFRARAPLPQRLTGWLRVRFVALVVAGLTAASVGVAGWLFSRWNGSALFGGVVINDSGTTETELGAQLRDELADRSADETAVVLVHQPSSAAGYVGVDDLDELNDAIGLETVPWDDGIPDLPAGIINIGHLHDATPPMPASGSLPTAPPPSPNAPT